MKIKVLREVVIESEDLQPKDIVIEPEEKQLYVVRDNGNRDRVWLCDSGWCTVETNFQ